MNDEESKWSDLSENVKFKDVVEMMKNTESDKKESESEEGAE